MTAEFHSGFAADIAAMIKLSPELGRKWATVFYPMQNFDRFCVREHPDATVLTRELVTRWCGQGVSPGPAYKAHAIRGFGKYLCSTGVEAFVLPHGWIPTPAKATPYVFTDAELVALLAAFDRIPESANTPLREYTVPVMFRLMLGCGLRPGEARRLRRRDVDLAGAMLTITETKRNKDRRIPFGTDLAYPLERYDQIAETRWPRREWFFQAGNGQPYPGRWVTSSYHLCQDLAGGIALGTTPYTLRHNYATRTLMRWVEDGKDLGNWLPYLSAYMGHESYASTAYYVHLLPERLAATGLTSLDDIIPEVSP